MMFAGSNKGKERYLTIMMNAMVPKLYDRHEYTLYDILHEGVSEGEIIDDATFIQGVREFRKLVFYDLLEAIEKQYEGVTATVEDIYHGLGEKSLGLDYQKIVDEGIDMCSAYLMICNAILDEPDFDGTECPEGRDDFYEAFLYNMELFKKLEQKAIGTSCEVLIADGNMK